MVLDRLANWQRYVPMHPGFAAAFNFLRKPETSKLPAGKHSVDDERLLAIVGRDRRAAVNKRDWSRIASTSIFN